MAVADGSPVNAANTNAAFLDKNQDTATSFTIGLNAPGSGAAIPDTQQAINDNADAITAIDDQFDPSTGHDHDGVNSKQVSAANLADYNPFSAAYQGLDITGATGLSSDVTAEFAGRSPGGDANTVGVLTIAPTNYVSLIQSNDGTEIEDPVSGNRVYGRITEAGGVWTLSYFINNFGTPDSPYDLTPIGPLDISIFFREVFGPTNPLPTITADVASFDSLNATQDIPDAEPGNRGLMNPTNQTFSGVKTFQDRPFVNGDPVVSEASAQDISNKALIDPSRVDFRKDTLANLTTYALTATDGQKVFATDTQEYFGIISGALVPEGSGGGGSAGVPDLDLYYAENFESFADTTDLLSTFSYFGPGTVVLDVVTPLNGTKGLLYTQGVGSAGDVIGSPILPISEKQENGISNARFVASYSGPDDEISIDFAGTIVLIKSGTQIYDINFITGPATVSYAVNTLVENVGALFRLDDVQLSTKVGAGFGSQGFATISEVQPSGTPGGSANSGFYQTRTLNTANGLTFGSLLANQITLVAGTYYFDFDCPAYFCASHKAQLFNITDGTVDILGQTQEIGLTGGNPDAAQTNAVLKGIITIGSPKTFEIRHRVETTRAIDGFGRPASFGDDEQYTTGLITKLA